MEFEQAFSYASSEAWNRYHATTETERYAHETKGSGPFIQQVQVPTLSDIISQAKQLVGASK